MDKDTDEYKAWLTKNVDSLAPVIDVVCPKSCPYLVGGDCRLFGVSLTVLEGGVGRHGRCLSEFEVGFELVGISV